MAASSVLVIGLEPALIDFSAEEYREHPGLNAELVRAALADDQLTLEKLGFDAHLCMIDFGSTAGQMLRKCLEASSFHYILIGAGVRLDPRNTVLFEELVNIVHQLAPRAKLCFNTKATDTAETVQRAAIPSGAC